MTLSLFRVLTSSSSLKAQGIGQTEAYHRLGYPRDARSFVRAAEIISFLNIQSVRLMTNNPEKIKDLTSYGINVSGTEALFIVPDNDDLKRAYLDKVHGQGHSIKIDSEAS